MLHVRSTVFACMLAMGTATATVPPEAWAEKGKKSGKKKAGKAGKADEAEDKGDKAAKKRAKKAARMEKAGKKAYVKGNYDDALIAFERAYEIDPQPKHLYNIARCHEQQGNLAKAADFYERYLRDAPEAEDREEVETRAELLTSKLKKTMGRLEVVSLPDGADLRIAGEGGKRDVKTPWSGWLAPGRYELSALMQGHDEFTRKIGLAAGENEVVEIDFVEEKAEPPAAAAADGPASPPEPAATAEPPEAEEPAAPKAEVAAAPSGEPPPPEDGGIGVVPLAAFGLAVVGLASWGAFGALQMAKAGEFEDANGAGKASGKTRDEVTELSDSANLYGAIANVSLAVAAAAGLTGGAVLLLSGGGDEATVGARWTW